MSNKRISYKMAFVVEKKEGDVREGEINVVDIMGVRRISPGVYLLKVDENTYAIPPEAGEEISDDFIEKSLAYRFLWTRK